MASRKTNTPGRRVVRHQSGTTVDLDAVEDRFRRVGRHSCILCNGPGHVVGIWEPSSEQRDRLLIPGGINRLYQYLLCFTCQRRPGSCQRIEEAILAKVDTPEAVAEMN